MIAEATVTKEQTKKIILALFKYDCILSFIIKMEPYFVIGELKTTIRLEGDPFLFESLKNFLRKNNSKVWEEFFKEKQEVIDVQQT